MIALFIGAIDLVATSFFRETSQALCILDSSRACTDCYVCIFSVLISLICLRCRSIAKGNLQQSGQALTERLKAQEAICGNLQDLHLQVSCPLAMSSATVVVKTFLKVHRWCWSSCVISAWWQSAFDPVAVTCVVHSSCIHSPYKARGC